GLLLRHGRSPQQQLRQPALGHGAEEVHHREGAAALVARAERARVLMPEVGAGPPAISRYIDVARVLARFLILNLAVALAKIAFGYTSGAISILSDGFHSLTDAASNLVGLVGVRAARRSPDEGS